MDVEATTAIRQAEVGTAKAMPDRDAEEFDGALRAWSRTQPNLTRRR